MPHDNHAGHSHSEKVDDESVAPKFTPGADVRVTDVISSQYKRRPEYAKGGHGIVQHVHGRYVPPDAEDEADAEYLYSVRFHSETLFDESDVESNEISIDIWENALEEV